MLADELLGVLRAQTGDTHYESLRCASELTGVVAFRLAESKEQPHDVPRPTWDSISDQMVAYFRARTGVTLELPDPVAAR